MFCFSCYLCFITVGNRVEIPCSCSYCIKIERSVTLSSAQVFWEGLINSGVLTDARKSGLHNIDQVIIFPVKIAGNHAIQVVVSRHGSYPAHWLCDVIAKVTLGGRYV